jgi:hypothetical protein
MQKRFLISGRIFDLDKNPLADLTVKAFDKDLPSLNNDQPLGKPTVTDCEGYYRIEFGENEFRNSEFRCPDIYIEVYDDTIFLGRSEVHYNAGKNLTIDLTVKPLEKTEPSEYENLVAAITPLIGSLSLASLTKEDVEFLVKETGLEAKQVEWLRSSAQLSVDTGVPAEAFYGWARTAETGCAHFDELRAIPWLELLEAADGNKRNKTIKAILEGLKQAPDEALAAALLEAIDCNIIPAYLKNQVDEVLLELRTYDQASLLAFGRVIDAETGGPLENVEVHVYPAKLKRTAQLIGTAMTNANGAFSFSYIESRDRARQRLPRAFRLELHVPGQREPITHEAQTVPGQDNLGDIRVTLTYEPTVEPEPPPVKSVVKSAKLKLSRPFKAALAEHEITTLADIRRAGDLSKLGISEDADQKSIASLEAHAQLNTLSADIETNQFLIDRGYTSVAAIARASRTEFVNLTYETLGDAAASRLHVQASAQFAMATNIRTFHHVEVENGFTANNDDQPLAPYSHTSCECEDCQTTVSPLAYLADLLDYAVRHLNLKDAPDPFSLAWLVDHLHQPFDELPASCESSEQLVRQVRLCIEVLRRYLIAHPPSAAQKDELGKLENEYRIAAYLALLRNVGTSFDEIRLVRTEDADSRALVAQKLGFSLSTALNPATDELRQLFLDPDIEPPKAPELTEQALEIYFGLVDTTRDPLSDGLVLDDAKNQIKRWSLQVLEYRRISDDKGMMIEWRRHTDDDGLVHVKLEAEANGVAVKLYRHKDRQDEHLVATGNLSGTSGIVTITDPNRNSGLTGSMNISYVEDDSQIALVALPRLLCWRLRELRRHWTIQDRPTDANAKVRPPIVDPDLIQTLSGLGSNKSVGFLYEARTMQIDKQFKALKTAREAAATDLEGLNEALMAEDSLGISEADLNNLGQQSANGEDIMPKLEALALEPEAFKYLLKIRTLASKPEPVLESEWKDVYDILVKVFKNRLADQWRQQEAAAGITLGPDFFLKPRSQPAAFTTVPPPPVSKWLVSPTASTEWLDTLESRIEQQRSLIAGMKDGVSSAEEATLMDLRDALVKATDAPPALYGVPAKAKWLTDRLFIDCSNDVCQKTTRVGQAIETIQNFIFAIRIHALRGVYPGLSLSLPASQFDDEWEWIGSYIIWRAAMFTWMYPENILMPSLRSQHQQTPGFRRFLEGLRAKSVLTEEDICRVTTKYLEYFIDVCSLELEATCKTYTAIGSNDSCLPPPARSSEVVHMFARNKQKKPPDESPFASIYWSYYDPQNKTGYAQTFWDWQIGLENDWVIDVEGALAYTLPSGKRYLYVFVRTLNEGTQALAFSRYDLDGRNSWQRFGLALPKPGKDAQISIVERKLETDPIRLRIKQDNDTYERALNHDGNDWEEGEWKPASVCWSSWTRIDSSFNNPFGSDAELAITAVSAVAWAPDQMGLFIVDPDPEGEQEGAVLWNWWQAGSWQTWAKLPDNGKPPINLPTKRYVTAIVREGRDEIDVYTVGSRDATIGWVFVNHFKVGQGWKGWTKLNNWTGKDGDFNLLLETPTSKLPSSVTAVSIPPCGAGLLFAVGNDQKEWVLPSFSQSPNNFDLWRQLDSGSSLRFEPGSYIGSVALPPNQAIIFLRQTEFVVEEGKDILCAIVSSSSQLVSRKYIDNSICYVADLFPQGAPVTAISRIPNHIDIFCINTSRRVCSNFAEAPFDNWAGWFQIGSKEFPSGSRITALSCNPNRIDLFAVGFDGHIWTTWWDASSGWHEWDPIHDITTAPGSVVAAVARSDHNLDIFVTAKDGGVYWTSWGGMPWSDDKAIEKPPVEIKPSGPSGSTLPNNDEWFIPIKREMSFNIYSSNKNHSTSTLTYLNENDYFVPMQLALQLHQQGQYKEALDWFRTVYHYGWPTAERKIAPMLTHEESLATTYSRPADWLLDPLNPHVIAATRSYAYSRFTILSIIQCLLDYADAEFTLDTPESVPRARTLYLMALDLLDVPDLHQERQECDDLIGELDIKIGDGRWIMALPGLLSQLQSIGNAEQIKEVGAQVKRIVEDGDEPYSERFAKASAFISSARAGHSPVLTLGEVIAGNQESIIRHDKALMTSPVIEQAVVKAGRTAADSFDQSLSAVSGLTISQIETEKPEISWLRQNEWTDLQVTAAPSENAPVLSSPAILRETSWSGISKGAYLWFAYIPAPTFQFCIPPNPLLRILRQRAELALYKIRHCRNIAGMERHLEPYAAPVDVETGMPMIGTGGQLVVPGLQGLPPTPYHYKTLIARAKELVQTAAQFEASMLSALEKLDIERYNLLKAGQDMELMQGQIRLQDLRIAEASTAVHLAKLQKDRAAVEETHWLKYLSQGETALEKRSLEALWATASLHLTAALFHRLAQTSKTISFWDFGYGVWSEGGQIYSSEAAAMATVANILSTQASFERRRMDWEYQRDLAQKDVAIAEQSIQLAQDRVNVVKQERVIAGIQAVHAEAVIHFLINKKFGNAELYEWMGNVLGRIYGYFLREATALAKLAANQLAFERQELPPPYIQGDYWQLVSTSEGGGSKTKDRRGLTGSARLLEDITRLDEHAFLTDKRKLQLTKTISLAQEAPAEFESFRRSGVLRFATTMEMFDREFPGHYLRLIRRVRMSVNALIPPEYGIRATLMTTAASRVVTGGKSGQYQSVVVRREPQIVSFCSPTDATGLFELDPQPEMLLPFEGLGVEMHWELRMPKAANRFNYQSISNVLFTLEYDALYSFDYREQVIQRLGSVIRGEKAFRFQMDFSDQWYQLHNVGTSPAQITVRFKTTLGHFEPNIVDPKIENILLYFVPASGKSFKMTVSNLIFKEIGGIGAGVGGPAVVEADGDGIISTRLGNGASWIPITDNRSVAGDWELSLPNTSEIRNRFKNKEITEILFVISYRGHTPEWA